MGCGQSKIENEEAVSRCKDRKQFMKESVSTRNAFAAAHSAYTMSLKNTGAALSDFAHGEVQNPSYIPTTTPTTPLHQSSPSTSASGAPQPPPPPPPPLLDTLLPPPPPPLHRAASMPEMKLPPKLDHAAGLAGPTIMEEDDEEEEAESHEKLVMRKKRSYKGSVNDPPPQQQQQQPLMTSAAATPLVESRATPELAWADYLFQSNQESMMGPTLGAVQEDVKMEEIHRNVVENVDVGVEVEEEVRKSAKVEVEPEKVAVVEAAAGGSVGKSSMKKGKGSVVGTGERRIAKGSVNLLQIFVELDDHFLKASESAHEVSKMLEATRLHYHSNFADNRGNDLRLYSVCINL